MLQILRRERRFHTTAAFDSDTIGVKPASEKASAYKQMMRDFPINDIISASTLEELDDAVHHVYDHLIKTKSCGYPVFRYLRLLEAVARDLCDKIRNILNSSKLLDMDFEDFDEVTEKGINFGFINK